ncbi:hypothetical protein ACFV19_20855 [Streptomyces griseoluteus]|uniref:hypothetical protein n=1 Tax=Streptomyces griseoluteus TaxID=29306 RepID=UPI0036CA4011
MNSERPPIADSIWASPAIRAAFAVEPPDFGAIITELQKKGIGQQEQARLTGITQSALSRIALGQRRLSDYAKVVDFVRGLGVPPELSPLAPTAARSRPVPDSEVWEAPAEIAADLADILATNTSVEALNVAELALEEVLSAYEADGPTGRHGLAGKTVDLRRSLIDLARGHHPASVRTRIFRLLGQVSAVLGYMAVNSGRHTRAEAYCRSAIALATDIGDSGLLIWAHGTRSFNAYYQRDYANAITYAQAGIAVAPAHPQAIRLYVNGLSRAQAKRGNPEALGSIHEALRLTDQHNLPHDLTPCISLAPYGRARTLANALTTQVALGDGAGALLHEPDVAGAIRPTDYWSRSLIGLDAATAHLACNPPQLEHAMFLGEQVATDRNTPMIISIYQRCHDLYGQACLSWADHPAVKRYAQVLHQLGQSPAGREFQRVSTGAAASDRRNGIPPFGSTPTPRTKSAAGVTMSSPM